MAGRAAPIRVVPLDVTGLLAYARRAGKDPAHRQTHLSELPAVSRRL